MKLFPSKPAQVAGATPPRVLTRYTSVQCTIGELEDDGEDELPRMARRESHGMSVTIAAAGSVDIDADVVFVLVVLSSALLTAECPSVPDSGLIERGATTGASELPFLTTFPLLMPMELRSKWGDGAAARGDSRLK